MTAGGASTADSGRGGIRSANVRPVDGVPDVSEVLDLTAAP